MSLVSLLLATWLLMPQAANDGARPRLSRSHPDDSTLVTSARQQPDSVRDLIAKSLALAVSPLPDSARETHLGAARQLAVAYAMAWSDSFLLRQITKFERWPPERRAAKVVADSLRRAGIDAVGREGVPAAMRLWRESLRRAMALGDSAIWAASLMNVGAGFYLGGTLDSATLYLERARDLAEKLGDHRTLGNAVGTLASVSKDRRELRRAHELYTRALEIRARSGDTRGVAADQNNLGLIAQVLGDLEGAERAFEAALALNRRYGRDRPAALNLTNLANIATITADYSKAAMLYREALAIHQARGDRVDAASVLHNLGLLDMRRGGYIQARTTLSEALAIYDRAEMHTEAVAVHRDLSAVYAAMGQLQTALAGVRRAERRVRTADAHPRVLGALALTRGDLAVELNMLSDAELQYARAERLYRAAGDAAGQAEAQQGRALLLILRENYARALQVLELAARTQTRGRDERAAALTSLFIGYAHRQRGDTAAARRTLTRAHATLRRVGDAVGEAAALAGLGDLAVETRAPLAAEAFYRSGFERLGSRRAPEVRWRLHAGLGEALRSRGATAEAARELRLAVAEIERTSAALRLEERRGAFLSDKGDVYAQLALTEYALGRNAEAFAVSERLRARQMLDLVTRGRLARATLPDTDMREREQDVRRQIAALTRSLEDAAAAEAGLREPALKTPALDVVREGLDRAQKEYANLLLEMRESDAEYARLVSGDVAPWHRVAARLAEDEALLEYLVADSMSLVFVLTADTIAAIELAIDRRTLRGLVDFARGVSARPDRGHTPGLWRSPLRRLHEHLIDPVEAAGLLRDKRALIIVPHGELHYLPFAALMRRDQPERFLIERFRVTYAPSASLWIRLGERPSQPRGNGVLALAPRPQTLPASRLEVAAIGRIYWDRATVLVGSDASERAFRAALSEKAVIHLASYGVLNKHNPLFSFVELARGEGESSGPNDGRLEVHEVFGLSLSARLLVLSACQTALGSGALADVPPGDDWVGLVRAFLTAGARSVVATLWPVEDEGTARFMERFHGEFAAGVSAGEALARAQRLALRDPRMAHPFYWAGFVVSGGR